MICSGCGREARDWFGDAWCDHCGGVMARPGFLIFRHVATVDGPGGRYPIVWDESASYYKFRYPYTSNQPDKAPDDGFNPDFRRRPAGFRTVSGSFDAVLSGAGNYAKGDGDGIELSFAPTSTEGERALGKV